MENVLQVENLTKVYGTRVAVDSVSFSVKDGEILGFLGANGAGKSTTMKMILGLTSITSGDVYICGKNVQTNFESAIVNVGGLIETPYLYPYLTGYGNLKFYASLYKGIKKYKIMEVASIVGLSRRLTDKVRNYSLGMKQRLGIAQALLHDPKLLVLDEPTNGLDANGIKEIKMLLKRLTKERGTSILISSHILSTMESLCDRIAIIDNGKLVEIKTLNEIKQRYAQNGSTYVKVGAPNFAGKLIQEKFNIKVGICGNKVLFNASEADLAKIIVTLTQNRVPIYSAGEVDYSLEDMFLNIVGKHSNIN